MIKNQWYAVLSSHKLKREGLIGARRFGENLVFFIPIDEAHSIIALRFYNKITGNHVIDKAIAWFGSRANRVVERQDKKIVETQIPKKSGIRMKEKLVAADRPIMEYRRKRQRLQE